MGCGEKKDSTAQAVAEIRHIESILEDPSERMYVDPYAHHMYQGSSIWTLMGGRNTRAFFDWVMDGFFDLLSLRTKWIDDAILSRAGREHDQLVILGAGYDTRGFRLDLPDGFVVWEVDQPDVQSRKRRLLEGLSTTDHTVAERLGKSSSSSSSSSAPHVEFLDVDFNVDSIGERLVSQPAFDRTKPTIVTLEGVTQYIPESATAATLKQVRSVLAEGSILAVSYVPSEVVEDTESVFPKNAWKVRWVLRLCNWIGEPWIGSYKTADFASFLKDCGYEVLEDAGFSDLNQRYLIPRNRGRRDDDLLSMERYVLARVARNEDAPQSDTHADTA